MQKSGIQTYWVVNHTLKENCEEDRLAYIEFKIGDSETELGIMDKNFAPIKNVTGGAIIYGM